MQKAINDLKGQLITDARTAIRAGRVDQATTLLGNANRLAPQDPDVQKAINDLKLAQPSAPTKVYLKVNSILYRVAPGGAVQVLATVDRNKPDSFQGPVALRINNLPPGIVLQNTGPFSILQGQNTTAIGLAVLPGVPARSFLVSIAAQPAGVPNAPVTTATFNVSVIGP